jgi:hypothetical protein
LFNCSVVYKNKGPAKVKIRNLWWCKYGKNREENNVVPDSLNK